MAWLAVDKDGKEGIFVFKPYRRNYNWSLSKPYEPKYWTDEDVNDYGNKDTRIFLPKGTIKKLIGKDLAWKDEPVELKEE